MEQTWTTGPRLALYFGCFRDKGHYLWHPAELIGSLHLPKDALDLPWTFDLMDGGLLKNRRVPDWPTGKISWLVGGRPHPWHAFFWWDRSVDQRPGSNSGLYVRGFGLERSDARPALEHALATWPEVASRQLLPLTLCMEEQPGGTTLTSRSSQSPEDKT